jgi:hypothetical protein
VSNDPGEADGTGGRAFPPLGGSTTININGLTAATAQITAFNQALASLQQTLSKVSQNSGTYASSLNKIGAAAGGGSGGGIMSSIGNVASSMFGTANERGWMRDFLMFPTRFMRSSITDNRQLALQASAGLGMQAFGSGASTQGMMGALAGQFGNVIGGNPQDLVGLMNIAGRVGAGVDWRYYANAANPGNPYSPGGNAPRSTGFFRSVYEAQRMNPGESVGNIAAAIGGATANVGGQQQAAFLTGGAFSMIGAGNKQKSISEWATGILKWLQNLRPGPLRGQPFTYSDLMSQNFPGSNIDAWLTANGVSEDMKQYFWSFAMAQASTGHSTVDQLFTNNAAVNTSVAFNRLQAQGAQTRTGFRLAGQMAGAYANKEQSNQFFAELMGHLLNQVLPSAMSSGMLSYMQYLPDAMEEIMMQLAERTTIGAAGAGVMGWGAGLTQMLGGPGSQGPGDLGDVGDFGSLGGTSSAGLHPDMRKRIDAMMNANPRLRVTSGFRDLGTQQRLKRKGVGRVSGRPSAHTRGMAADMGPRSEYPWLVRNARKFGLSSGVGQGEPWHVGMGDVGDWKDIVDQISSGSGIESMLSGQFGGVLEGLMGKIFNFMGAAQDPNNQIQAIGKSTSVLMQALMGLFGGTADPMRIAYRDVYSGLVGAAEGATFEGLTPGVSTGGGWWGNILKKITEGARTATATGAGAAGAAPGGSATAPPAAGQNLSAFFTQVLSSLGAPVTENNLLKLAAIAKIEGNRGGTFNPFNSVNVTAGSTRFNSAGVQNYPDWSTGVAMTVKQINKSPTSIPGGPEMAIARGNLLNDGAWTDWLHDMSAFYTSWGGSHGASLIMNTTQSRAAEMLGHTINAGDVSDYYTATPMAAPTSVLKQTPMIFHNNFTIEGGGGANGGIDIRRTVTMLADQLETEMNRRMARRN